MKKIIEQVQNEGLEGLLGQRVLLMCAGYFYEGKLVGVAPDFVKLDDAAIVYSTGSWSDKSYSDIQKLHQKEWYVSRGLIESFGKSKWLVREVLEIESGAGAGAGTGTGAGAGAEAGAGAGAGAEARAGTGAGAAARTRAGAGAGVGAKAKAAGKRLDILLLHS